MGKGSAPKFDANAAIAAQQTANNTATANNAKAANKYGPFGSTTTNVDANGMPTGQTQTLAGQLNTAADNTMGTVADASTWQPQSQFKLSDVPHGLPLADATFKQGMNYMQPEFDRQNKQLEVRMAERGLPIGSEAWKDASDITRDQQNRAVTDLTQRALLMTPAEEQRQIGNALTERNQGYADANAGVGLLGGIKGLLPNGQEIAQQTPVNAMGAMEQQYKSDQAAYQAKQQAIQQAIKMGVSLAAAPMTGGASLGTMFNGGGSPGLITGGYDDTLPWLKRAA